MLSEQQKLQIAELVAARPEEQKGNHRRVMWSKTPQGECSVCGAKRHACKWGEMRRCVKAQKAHTRGSVCYCCVRACLALGANCRSVELYRAVPGAFAVWLAQSKIQRAALSAYDGDKCACHECS
eukprot:s2855_g7.t1